MPAPPPDLEEQPYNLHLPTSFSCHVHFAADPSASSILKLVSHLHRISLKHSYLYCVLHSQLPLALRQHQSFTSYMLHGCVPDIKLNKKWEFQVVEYNSWIGRSSPDIEPASVTVICHLSLIQTISSLDDLYSGWSLLFHCPVLGRNDLHSSLIPTDYSGGILCAFTISLICDKYVYFVRMICWSETLVCVDPLLWTKPIHCKMETAHGRFSSVWPPYFKRSDLFFAIMTLSAAVSTTGTLTWVPAFL